MESAFVSGYGYQLRALPDIIRIIKAPVITGEGSKAMAGKITILSPAAEAWRPTEATVPHLADLRGATVAILNNRWTSMNIIAEQISIILKEQYGVAEVFQKLIPLASAAPQETFDEVHARAQLAVVGLAN